MIAFSCGLDSLMSLRYVASNSGSLEAALVSFSRYDLQRTRGLTLAATSSPLAYRVYQPQLHGRVVQDVRKHSPDNLQTSMSIHRYLSHAYVPDITAPQKSNASIAWLTCSTTLMEKTHPSLLQALSASLTPSAALAHVQTRSAGFAGSASAISGLPHSLPFEGLASEA